MDEKTEAINHWVTCQLLSSKQSQNSSKSIGLHHPTPPRAILMQGGEHMSGKGLGSQESLSVRSNILVWASPKDGACLKRCQKGPESQQGSDEEASCLESTLSTCGFWLISWMWSASPLSLKFLFSFPSPRYFHNCTSLPSFGQYRTSHMLSSLAL